MIIDKVKTKNGKRFYCRVTTLRTIETAFIDERMKALRFYIRFKAVDILITNFIYLNHFMMLVSTFLGFENTKNIHLL